MKRSIDAVALTREEVEERMRHGDLCCEAGVRMPCTCVASVECDIHGSICFGQHLGEMVA